jgi:hypothetical protein
MEIVEYLQRRVKETDTDLEETKKQLSFLNSRIGSLARESEAYRIALDAEIRKQGNIDNTAIALPVNGLSNDLPVNGLSSASTVNGLSSTAIAVNESDDNAQKSVLITRIIEESGADGVTSGEIIQTLKDRGVEFDAAYVYSFLSRAKSKGKLEYKDNKYFFK